MRKLLRLLVGIACAILLLGNSNCSNSSNSSGSPVFVTTLSITDASGNAATSFVAGTTIEFVLTVRNRTNTAQTLFFSNSEQSNFAVVSGGGGNVIWNADHALTPTSGSTSITIQPNSSQTITASWNQTDNGNHQVAGGNTTYEVIGGVTVYNTVGVGSSADTSGDVMPAGIPNGSQLFPSVYRSPLMLFSIQ